jgi:hypothetical protein
MRRAQSVLDRIFALIASPGLTAAEYHQRLVGPRERASPCWHWTGSFKDLTTAMQPSRPQIRNKGRPHDVRRLLMETVASSPLPLKVRFKQACQTRHCVNPHHFEVVAVYQPGQPAPAPLAIPSAAPAQDVVGDDELASLIYDCRTYQEALAKYGGTFTPEELQSALRFLNRKEGRTFPDLPI